MEQQIVEVARTWIGTPFLHQGRKKHIGCDCIGLIVGVLNEMGVALCGKSVSELDQRDYTMQPDGRRLKAALVTYLKPVDIAEMKVGSIALMCFEKEPQHVGVVGSTHSKQVLSSGLTLIHSYQGIGKVVEHQLDEKWRRRIVAVYRL